MKPGAKVPVEWKAGPVELEELEIQEEQAARAVHPWRVSSCAEAGSEQLRRWQ